MNTTVNQTATPTSYSQIADAITHIEWVEKAWRTSQGADWTYQVLSPLGETIVDCGTVYRRHGDPDPEVLLEASNPVAMRRRLNLREERILLTESEVVRSGSEGWIVWRDGWADPALLPDRIWVFWHDRSESTREGWYITSQYRWHRINEKVLCNTGFILNNTDTPRDGEVRVFIRKNILSQTDLECPPCRVVSRP